MTDVGLEPKKLAGYTEFFSWGHDNEGQLGHGLEENTNVTRKLSIPKSLSFEVFINQVACGSHHSAFISQDGHVFTFGSNREGQLGINDPSMLKSTAPLLVAEFMTMRIIPLTIACGGFHTALLSNEGEIYTWGLND
jgi:alpha-tubulin suppressor-like RCC1 family protein